MNKKIKIFKNEANIYSGNCYVNTVIFRGRIYGDFKEVGQGGVKFSLQLSNGKERVAPQDKPRTMLGEHNYTNCSRIYSDEEKSLERWRKPTFADCTAFGAVSKKILNEYKPKGEIWLIAKYYSKRQQNGFFKRFVVREIITEEEIQQAAQELIDNEDLPF